MELPFVALASTIWRMRNRVIFQRDTFDEEGCFEIWHFDLAWWFKIEWEKQTPFVADII